MWCVTCEEEEEEEEKKKENVEKEKKMNAKEKTKRFGVDLKKIMSVTFVTNLNLRLL